MHMMIDDITKLALDLVRKKISVMTLTLLNRKVQDI